MFSLWSVTHLHLDQNHESISVSNVNSRQPLIGSAWPTSSLPTNHKLGVEHPDRSPPATCLPTCPEDEDWFPPGITGFSKK